MSTQIFRSAIAVFLTLVFLSCSFFTPKSTSKPSIVGMEKEEQAVYSFFVAKQGTVLILRDTSTNISDDNPRQTIDSLRSNWKDVGGETLDSYLERNKQLNQLSPTMDLGTRYILLSPEELAKVTSQPNWHQALKEKYPSSNGYLIFSRVGFNNTLDQALIYVGNVAGPLMGAGYYYLMQKKDGEWRIKDQMMVWIS